MREMIWLVSVLFGFLGSFCWSVVVFTAVLPAALRLPPMMSVAPLSLLVSFISLVIWVAGLMIFWKNLIHATERLVMLMNLADSEKKKKRPPQSDEPSI